MKLSRMIKLNVNFMENINENLLHFDIVVMKKKPET